MPPTTIFIMKLTKRLIILLLFTANQLFAQQKADLISYKNLSEKIRKDTENVYIVNFWATWCGPCVKEIPDFQKFLATNTNKKVKLILVSLDFSNELKKVNAFVAKKKLKIPVYIMSDTDQNSFIDKISNKWDGTIPATWFVNAKKEKEFFIEKPINAIEIKEYLKQVL
jgi:thiol-disulfide isomerase/thioredoxin